MMQEGNMKHVGPNISIATHSNPTAMIDVIKNLKKRTFLRSKTRSHTGQQTSRTICLLAVLITSYVQTIAGRLWVFPSAFQEKEGITAKMR
jgi:hypothetical protein